MQNNPRAAMLCMLCAMLIVGVIDNYVVVLAAHGGLWQFHFIRTLLALPVFLALAALGVGRLRPINPGVVLLRSVLMAFAMVLYFGCLAFLPLAQVLAGLFTSPIFVMLLSAIFLGQTIGKWRILAVAIGFSGSLLVLQPDITNLGILTVLPVLAGFLYGCSSLITRTLCAGEDTLTLLFGFFVVLGSFGAVGLIVLGLYPQDVPQGPDGFILRGWVMPNATFLTWTAVQAFGSIVAIGSLIRAYQMADASFVSVFEYSVMVFGPLAAFWLFGQTLNGIAMMGVAMIILAGTIIAVRAR
ncbi:DMT family transporter [Algirhabdus cladophorae]|uniref:DMT family transporter n=1 Tax=Algirhabdus cladophorae TaxID=3377108 RepID=UPI003B847CC0